MCTLMMPDITAKWTSKTDSCVKKLERQLCAKETSYKYQRRIMCLMRNLQKDVGDKEKC